MKRCTHHWLLDTPDGEPEVWGKCRKCSKERAFAVTGSETEYEKQSRENRQRKRERGQQSSKKGATA